MKALWMRKTEKYEISNCMVCTVITSIEWAPMLLPLKGMCRHCIKTDFSENPRFEERKYYKWFSVLILILMSLAIVWDINVFVTNMRIYSRVQRLMIVSDQIFSVCGVTLAACISLKWRGWMTNLNEWCDIVDRRNDFGITNLATSSFCREITIKAIIARILLFFVYLLSCMLGIILLLFSKIIFLEAFVLTEITLVFSISVQFTATFICSHQLTVMKAMVKNAKNQLFVNMADPNNCVVDLEGFLRKYAKFFLAMANVYRNSSNVINPGIIFWLIISVTNLIINIYLFIIQWEDEYFWKITILEIRTFALILILGYLITIADTKNIVSI